MVKCDICNGVFNNTKSLGSHRAYRHGIVGGQRGVQDSCKTLVQDSCKTLVATDSRLLQDSCKTLGKTLVQDSSIAPQCESLAEYALRVGRPVRVVSEAEGVADKVLRQGYVIDKPGRFQDVDWGKVAFVVVVAFGAAFAAYRAYEYIDWEPKKKSISPYKIVGSLISGIGGGRGDK